MGDTDQILATIDAMVNGATQITQQADAILTLLSNLNTTADNLNPKLTTQAKAAFETFWASWSAELLNVADSAEALGTLLAKAAIDYLKTDSNIAKAFHANKDLEKEVGDKINSINNQVDNFNKMYNEDAEKQNEVMKQAKADANADPVVGHDPAYQGGAALYQDRKSGDLYYKTSDGKKVYKGLPAQIKHAHDPDAQ